MKKPPQGGFLFLVGSKFRDMFWEISEGNPAKGGSTCSHHFLFYQSQPVTKNKIDPGD
jgi:hypothetical protein